MELIDVLDLTGKPLLIPSASSWPTGFGVIITWLLCMVHRRVRQLLWLLPVLIIAWLLVLDFVPGGRLEVGYNFEDSSPFISRLSPDGRVLPIQQNDAGEYYQGMVIEPVYFDVRLPQAFEQVRVEILYHKDSGVPLKLGYRTPGDWSWVMKDVQQSGTVGEWERGEVDFSLSEAQYIDRQLRFILASPGLPGSGQEIKFRLIEMEFEKERLRWGNVLQRFSGYLRTWV